MDSCSATSGPGWRARMFFSSMYSFSFSWISRSFSTTSSVLAISRFCSVWIFWIISYVDGSDPSSLRQRCTLSGFSSSSLSALTLVRSDSSSRPSWCTSRLSTSMLATLDLRMCSSRFKSLSLILSTRISLSRSRYWIWPLDSVDCWILIFSYSSASSSLRRMSCVPRMSRSLTTMSYSFFCRMRSWSASLMMWFSFSISAFWLLMAVSASLICCLALFSSMRSASFSFSTFMWSKCSLTSARSLAEISSLSCSIWCCMILNLRFISWISSCDSIRFLE
mmetsp:Transcript_12291/g.30039  ORF Transcript_12291/g.30039 Transcript_12291/m.30039 type:complete len:279 (+) Transcript_12291:616-1452(+)